MLEITLNFVEKVTLKILTLLMSWQNSLDFLVYKSYIISSGTDYLTCECKKSRTISEMLLPFSFTGCLSFDFILDCLVPKC